MRGVWNLFSKQWRWDNLTLLRAAMRHTLEGRHHSSSTLSLSWHGPRFWSVPTSVSPEESARLRLSPVCTQGTSRRCKRKVFPPFPTLLTLQSTLGVDQDRRAGASEGPLAPPLRLVGWCELHQCRLPTDRSKVGHKIPSQKANSALHLPHASILASWNSWKRNRMRRCRQLSRRWRRDPDQSGLEGCGRQTHTLLAS